MMLPLLLLLLGVATQRSFVDTAPSQPAQGDSPEIIPETLDSNVKELESLKQSIGKTLELMKTHSSVYKDVDGHKESHSDSRSEVKEDGKMISRVGQHVDAEIPVNGGQEEGSVRTDVEIPSKGIHKSLVQQFTPDYTQYTDNGNRRSPLKSYDNPQETNTLDRYRGYSGTQYSPLDMAEYVFWTGDEKGVTLAIEEFLQEGLMSREEAISFLQEIKYNLDYLQNHYTQLGLNAREHSKESAQQRLPNPVEARPELKSNFDISKLRQPAKKNDQTRYRKEEMETSGSKVTQPQPEEEYDELLERLRVADFLYTEYSLEEVIYQLAKVMFTQSLTKGSAEAQQALQKFTTFLETEADQGHISRSLEKKVLDVLIASLTDTLSEHPELSADATSQQSNSDGQNILRQILRMSPEEKSSVQMALGSYKTPASRINLQSLHSPVDIQMKEKIHTPLGLGKYKTIR